MSHILSEMPKMGFVSSRLILLHYYIGLEHAQEECHRITINNGIAEKLIESDIEPKEHYYKYLQLLFIHVLLQSS